MKILVIGSSSFASQNTVVSLQMAGHEIWTFDRRMPLESGPRSLTGSSDRMVKVCEAAGTCDVLINYLLLKGASVEENIGFCDQLVELTRRLKVKRFIHLSSVIVADAQRELVTEAVPIEEQPARRPPYSRLKIETERCLREKLQDCELVVVRPGFILGPGLADPMPGIGRLLPNQRILGMGWKQTVIPMISRDIVDEAIMKLCKLPLPSRELVVQLTDAVSPTRQEYLGFCCTGLGLGRGVWHWPRWFWWLGLATASPLLAIKQRRWRFLPGMFTHNMIRRKFDATASEKLLGITFHRPWRDLVTAACESQQPNYRVPLPAVTGASLSGEPVLYIGLGRIVQERHLPALERLGFRGEVEWFDPRVKEPGRATALRLRRLNSLNESRATRAVIATPAFTRSELVGDLPPSVRRVLFEKPFALSLAQADELTTLLAGRETYVLHNYRYKANSQALLAALHAANAGRLIETRLHFDSPAVDHDGVAWMRDERRARTLLMDYGLHFADLAMLLAEGEAEWRQVEFTRNARRQTACIQALARFANHDCRLFLRQGARQRRCEIEYIFQNCTAKLGFFPDTFRVARGSHTFLDDMGAAMCGAKATAGKIFEKLGLRAQEPSHRHVLGSFLCPGQGDNMRELRLDRMASTYRSLLKLADRVYADPP